MELQVTAQLPERALDGLVYRVEGNPSSGNYGIHVRIKHRDGFSTIYAHLMMPAVAEGDVVTAGQVIGLADNTGNSSGDHLHLTLKRDGATASGQTKYPNDIIDPTPYLLLRESARPQSGKVDEIGRFSQTGGGGGKVVAQGRANGLRGDRFRFWDRGKVSAGERMLRQCMQREQ